MDIVIAAAFLAALCLAYVLISGPAVLDQARQDWARDSADLRQRGECDG